MFEGKCTGNGERQRSSLALDRYLPGYVRLSIRMRHAASSADQERLSVRIGLDRFERSGAYSYCRVMTIAKAPSPLSTSGGSEALLIVIAGPARGRSVRLDGTVTVGRDEQNLLPIPDPALSRHHCLIERAGDRVVLKDMGSKNGVFVNGCVAIALLGLASLVVIDALRAVQRPRERVVDSAAA